MPIFWLGEPPAVFSGIEIVSGEVRLTVENASGGAQLESSTDLETWTARNPAERLVDENTKVLTLPANQQFEFFRIKE